MSSESDHRLLHFELIERLGRGPRGHVFKARDTQQDCIVALKLLYPQAAAARGFFEHSLPVLARLQELSHPNICSVLGMYRVQRTQVVVMEYLDGTSVRQLIHHEPLDTATFQAVAEQVSAALSYAHELNIVHGNLKPSNVMVTDSGVVKVLDFGLGGGLTTDEPAKLTELTEGHFYLSPQRIAGRPLSAGDDLFAVGVLFYVMLTGRHPFTGSDREAVHQSILNDEPDLTPLKGRKVPDDVLIVVDRLLAKLPEGRFADSHVLHTTLHEIGSYTPPSRTSGFLTVKPRTPRQYLMLSLLAFLLVVFWFVVTTYRH
jgi:serine/threonine-protein kinase